MSTPTNSGKERQKSLLISMACGATLLVLALTVFAVASQARSLSSQAERAVQTVENLRVVSLARSEISVASRLASSAPDEIGVITGAIDNANARLDEVEANFDESTGADIQGAFTNFRSAVDEQGEALTADAGSEELTRVEIATGEAFTELSEVMREAQLTAIAGLEADNDLMNLIATISTFVVAFVVPSAALFTFQALRSAPREMRELRFQHDRLERRSAAMAETIGGKAAELRSRALVDPESVTRTEILRSLLRFEHIAVSNGAPTAIRNEQIDINATISEILANMGLGSQVRFTGADEVFAIADPKQLEIVTTELVTNALVHGAAPMQVSTATHDGKAMMYVVDSGNGLADDTVNALIHESEFELREDTAEGAFGYGLRSARRAMEAMGGTLSYERKDGRTYLIASLPGAGADFQRTEVVSQAA